MPSNPHHHHHHNRPPRTGGGGGGNHHKSPKQSKLQHPRDAASKGSFGLNARARATAVVDDHHQEQQGHNNNISASNDDSVVGVSSVHLPHQYALTRDNLSDLSGSYCHKDHPSAPSSAVATATSTASSSESRKQKSAVVVPIYSNSTGDTPPWRHAQILSSSRLPQHPQPHNDDNSSVGIRNKKKKNRNDNIQSVVAKILDSADLPEIELQVSSTSGSATAAVSASSSTCAANNSSGSNKSRTPLLLLLMDPNRRLYELMQIWMDATADTVRDILQVLTQNLQPSHWKQDYDGLFQVRNNHFSQLIHVLDAGKYQVVSHEVWVCKPWSMSAKSTVGYASTLLNHLKHIGILEYKKSSLWKQPDTVLTLSKKGQKRVYVPQGILKHHHACQFLSFVPPFEARRPPLTASNSSRYVQQVTIRHGTNTIGGIDDTASALSDSHGSYYTQDDDGDDSDRGLGLQLTTGDDAKSQTESTYSTTGSASPIPKRKELGQQMQQDIAAVSKRTQKDMNLPDLAPRTSSLSLSSNRNNKKDLSYRPSPPVALPGSKKDASNKKNKNGGGSNKRWGRFFQKIIKCRNRVDDPYEIRYAPQAHYNNDWNNGSSRRSAAVLREASRPSHLTDLYSDAASQCSGAPLLLRRPPNRTNDDDDWTDLLEVEQQI